MTELVFLLLLAVIFWFWRDSLRARERARAASVKACRDSDVQLLDDTVALEKIGLRRGIDGRVCLERLYAFEFTDTGLVRRRGIVILIGEHVEVLAMDGGDLFVP